MSLHVADEVVLRMNEECDESRVIAAAMLDVPLAGRGLPQSILYVIVSSAQCCREPQLLISRTSTA